MIDSNNVENILPSTDTLRVIKDSIINGQTYAVLERTVNSNTIMFPAPYFSPTNVVRDSLHYLVASSGNIFFSSQDFNSTLLDLSRTRTENGNTFTDFSSHKMKNVADSVTVPAGTFKVLNFEGTYSSTDPILNTIYTYKNRNQYYAKGVGKILESYVFAEKRVLEQRLLEYHIQ
jgi:hypothetical protein